MYKINTKDMYIYMNVLDSRCSVLTSLVMRQIPNIVLSGDAPDTKLVNTLHFESNTFIYYIHIPSRLIYLYQYTQR